MWLCNFQSPKTTHDFMSCFVWLDYIEIHVCYYNDGHFLLLLRHATLDLIEPHASLFVLLPTPVRFVNEARPTGLTPRSPPLAPHEAQAMVKCPYPALCFCLRWLVLQRRFHHRHGATLIFLTTPGLNPYFFCLQLPF